MRTGRPIFFSLILALGAAGAVMASPAIASAATHAPNIGVHTNSTTVGSDVYMHT
jgi:hypothetical protein